MNVSELMDRIRHMAEDDRIELYRDRVTMDIRKYTGLYRLEVAGIMVAFDDMEPAAVEGGIMLLFEGRRSAVIRNVSEWSDWIPPTPSPVLSVRACPVCGDQPVRIGGPDGYYFECAACRHRSAPSHSLAKACASWNGGAGQ